MKRQYDKEFKVQTVKHIVEQGKSVAQVARELDISVNTLHGWVKQYKQYAGEAFVGTGHLRTEDQA